MTIDIHVHPAFYEPINADAAREELRHCELDIHRNGLAPLEHVFNQMRCASLDRLCLLAQDYSTQMGETLVSNEEVAQLVSLAPDRFWGVASVDPLDSEAPDKLEDAFSRMGLKGLNLHPGRSRLRICLGHFGWPWIRETAMLLLKYPNVYADTAALYFDNAREFYTQCFTRDIPFYTQCFTRDIPLTWIDRSLRHQVMFGSDNPRFEQIRMAEALGTLGLRDSTLELIRGENALVFLGEGDGA